MGKGKVVSNDDCVKWLIVGDFDKVCRAVEAVGLYRESSFLIG